MSTKYTPAPWRVHHSHGYLVIESDNEEMFVQVTKGIGKEKDLANARLIAAAPESIEALQLARKELHACQAVIHLHGGFDPAYVNDAQKALKIIDAAIAKALGE